MIWFLRLRRNYAILRSRSRPSTTRRVRATTVDEPHELQDKIKDLEKKKRRQRQRIFDVEDEIMEKRDRLIDALEKRMQ